jgi:hypothetical protein
MEIATGEGDIATRVRCCCSGLFLLFFCVFGVVVLECSCGLFVCLVLLFWIVPVVCLFVCVFVCLVLLFWVVRIVVVIHVSARYLQ